MFTKFWSQGKTAPGRRMRIKELMLKWVLRGLDVRVWTKWRWFRLEKKASICEYDDKLLDTPKMAGDIMITKIIGNCSEDYAPFGRLVIMK
jgi:hypothetical protein